MSVAVFGTLLFAAFFNSALRPYTHFQTYPLLAWVDRDAFRGYHGEYERRLPVALYAPYALLLALNVPLLALRPPGVSGGDLRRLARINAARLAASLAGSAIVLLLLLRVLAS